MTGSTPLKWQAGLGPAELELDESKLDEVAVAGTAVAGGGPVVAAIGGAVLGGLMLEMSGRPDASTFFCPPVMAICERGCCVHVA